MRVLNELVDQIEGFDTGVFPSLEISKICERSQDAEVGALFVAVRGTESDGHNYIDDAISRGATAIVAEIEAPSDLASGVYWFRVRNSRSALGKLAARWFETPSAELPLVGVTGTNGKTTVTWIIYSLLKELRGRAGLIGTIGLDSGEGLEKATHTTPSAIRIQEILRQIRENHCGGAAMEVSSHGLDQKRVEEVHFDCGIFTNLTQDHLDYHQTMENYYLAKRQLFEQLSNYNKKKSYGIINTDDSHGLRLYKEFEDRLKLWSYGFGKGNYIKAGRFVQSVKGSEFQMKLGSKTHLVRTPFIGRFNVYNVLAALGALKVLGINVRDSISALQKIKPVPGRMERVGQQDRCAVFIDYAHTPDALENACQTVLELKPRRLITVFGCGGDRDKAKRPMMGRIAAKYSDVTYVTSDNPRSEDPEVIINDIIEGIKDFGKIITLTNRTEAISEAIREAGLGDAVLIAGKGHEDYQQFADRRVTFDDRIEAQKALSTFAYN